jgi:hypothetical protein
LLNTSATNEFGSVFSISKANLNVCLVAVVGSILTQETNLGVAGTTSVEYPT